MRVGVVALALVLALPLRASAEWQLKPFFGATFAGATSFFVPIYEPDALRNRHKTFGVGGLYIGELFGVEGDFGRTPGFFHRKSCEELAPDCLVLGSSLTALTANLVVAVPRRLTEFTLRPYVVGGGGWMWARSDAIEELAFKRRLLALDIGGGATGFLTDRVGVSWDLRYFHTVRGREPDNGGEGIGGAERVSFWRVNMAFVVRLRRSVSP